MISATNGVMEISLKMTEDKAKNVTLNLGCKRRFRLENQDFKLNSLRKVKILI